MIRKLKYLIKIIWALLCLLFLFGCGPAKEVTEIKPSVIHPPVIEDSIRTIIKTDTVIVGVDVIKNDTVTVVKYFPKYEKFYIKVKPDSVVVFDTVKTYQTVDKIIETPFLSKLGLVAAGLIAGSVIFFLLKKGML